MDTAVNNTPKDLDYFKKYYQNNNKGVMMSCPHSHRLTSKVNLSKHLKRNICFKVSAALNAIVEAYALGMPRAEIPDTADHENIENP